MIDADRLLADCKALVQRLEADLRERVDAHPDLHAALAREHAAARDAGRTRRPVEEWERERITQAAVAWVLGCVFVRFLEDTGLVETARLAGPGDRLRQARERQTHHFREHPADTAREYLLDTFRAVAALPGCAGLFDERTNPLFALSLSGDAANLLVERWRAIDPDSGALVHDFTDPTRTTRFLGDLYQDLSEAAKKQYALLQTPEFVEEFILDRTLEPAIDEFGLAEVRVIDPACGSGHFLLGAFARLLAHWRAREPGTDVRTLVERSLAAVSGVDLNPFAAEIARFRLLVAAVHACGVARLRNAPDLRPEVVVGDSLLHGTRPDRRFDDAGLVAAGMRHLYATEDADAIARVLNRRYHVVVANPPYITPKDPALKAAYRARFSACSGKYALGVPFMQLLFDLALPPANGQGPGYVGQITSNSFMKREFGKKLIEEHLARLDVTLIVDTSGAYIPGHGTPTVILVGRTRPPLAPTVRTVMGSRGEPTTPPDPARGVVWVAILDQVDRLGSESAYVTVEDVLRERYATHPWSIGGGGASDLLVSLGRGKGTLSASVDSIGFSAIAGSDDVFATNNRGADYFLEDEAVWTTVDGSGIRDWHLVLSLALAPMGSSGTPLEWSAATRWSRRLWPWRALHSEVLGERGIWWTWYSWATKKLKVPLSIPFAEVSTHNHFVLDRGGKVFKQTAPVIKLLPGASEDAHLGLLGLLNSSTACFWFKQVCQTKGSSGIGRGVYDEKWEFFFQLNGTKVGQLPVPAGRPIARAQLLDRLAQELASSLPAAMPPTRQALGAAPQRAAAVRAEMVALQEEMDWEVYGLYELVNEDLTYPDPPPLQLGERAFEILLARRVTAGEEETAWFERHGSTPTTELPTHWPADYRALVERRIALIESDRDLGLIERPEHKRRWQWELWEKQEERALRAWLLDRLEGARHWGGEPRVTSCARLADEARKDAEFREVAELYAGRADIDLARLVEELVVGEAVPFLAAWRHTDGGLRTHTAWERTWALQRQEDAIDALCGLPDGDPRRLTPEQAQARKRVEVATIPVPPKYSSKDFRKGSYWALRGKLDVPKERFILYPGCERAADPSPVIGWAGWNHLERAQALAQHLTRLRQEDGWDAKRLTPLLAGLAELLPWVLQWHNEHDSSLGRRIGDAYSEFLRGQLAELGLTDDALAAWRPPAPTRGRRRKGALA